MAHDFERFPELTNSQMAVYYFESPHKQIFEDFEARVVNVHDGDTITVEASFRDFDFPIRLADINAPELSEGEKARDAKSWLTQELENEFVTIRVDRFNRVGKFGRLIGRVIHAGLNVGDEMLRANLVEQFDRKGEADIPNMDKTIRSDLQ